MPEGKAVKIRSVIKLPSPYNDFLFRNLNSQEYVDLIVHYLWRQSSRHPWTVEMATGYPHIYMRTFLGIDWNLLNAALQERDSFFLVGDWAHIPIIVVVLARILTCTPVALWVDTPQEHLPRPWPKRQLRRRFLSWLLSHVDTAFGTGQPAKRELTKLGLPKERFVNLPYFVDLQRPQSVQDMKFVRSKSKASREMAECTGGGIVFLMAGTCEQRKGHDLGIKAFTRCQAATGTNMGMIIAGDGPERGALEELAHRLGVANRIAFVGWLNPDEMDAAYAACDIVLHTARWDPFPLVVLEGMNWGKVVIGSDVCGSVQDRIVHGVNGFVFPSEDVDALAAIMKELVLQPEKMQKIGLEARRTAEAWPVARGVDTIVQTARQVMRRH